MSTKKYILLILAIVLGTLSSFYSGFFLKDLLQKQKPSTDIQKNSFLPYFEDEIIIVSKEKPYYTVIASASRFTEDNASYLHNQKAFFFDGSEWKSQSSRTESDGLKIAPTQAIPRWNINDDPSLVLKQSVEGEVIVNEKPIRFEIPVINNELGFRSLSNYTVTRSESDGKLIIEDKEYESYVLYSRTYSYNTSILSVPNTDPLGINTDWIAFWDINGNFYNIDKTTVDEKYKGEYKSHSIAVFKSSEDSSVKKTFDVDIQKNGNLGYEIKLSNGLEGLLDVNFLNSTSKRIVNPTTNWTTGHIEGEIRLENGKVIKGFGLYERIYQ